MAKTATKAAKKAAAKKTAAKKPASRKKTSMPSVSGDKQRFTLYGTMTSGPTYTVGLMLSLCRHPFSYIHVNLREGQHKQPDYLVKNRYGQVPTLRDRQSIHVQSASILEHLSDSLKKFNGRRRWKNSGCASGCSGSGTNFLFRCCVCAPGRAASASSATMCA